jgi:uncharacterized membrane protein
MNNGAAVEQKPDRLIGIDASRGLAILFMVFSHGLHWLYTGTSHDLVLLFDSLSLGDLATPVFFTLAGLSLYLSTAAQLRKGLRPSELFIRYRKRFSQLFFVGVCLSITWGVLQVQALVLITVISVFLFCLPRYGPERSRLIILYTALAYLAVHQLVAISFNYAPYLFLFRGQFPYFAVVGMSGIGFFSSVLLKYRFRNLYYIFSGVLLIAVSQLLRYLGIELHRFDAPAPFILLGLGITFICTGFLNSIYLRDSIIVRYLAYVGRDALFLFVFHYVALFLPVYLLGFHNKLGPLPALLTSASFIIIVMSTAKRRLRSSFSVYQLTDIIFSRAHTLALRTVFSVHHFVTAVFSLMHSSRGVEVK